MRNQVAGSGGEIQLADAINLHATSGNVDLVHLNGMRFDCGSVNGYLEAIHFVANRDGLIN